jgi:hypothetical protein
MYPSHSRPITPGHGPARPDVADDSAPRAGFSPGRRPPARGRRRARHVRRLHAAARGLQRSQVRPFGYGAGGS